jgi:Tfp pilus assembly protein PilX
MTNSYRRNVISKNSLRGATTLVIATMLIVTATLIVIFAASFSVMQQKITSNQYNNQQAYQAAEAGMEFGINYLLANNATIIASPASGHIRNYTSTAINNVVLNDGSKFNIVYTNPVANNYTLIQVTTTGTSADGSSVRTVSQQMQYGSVLFTPSHNALTAKGDLTMSGNGTITNTQYNSNAVISGNATMSGNVHTVTSSGTSSTPGNMQADVQQNNATLAAMSINTLFSDYFGASMTTIKSTMAHTYSNTTNTNYSSTLNGMTGTTIWIDQPAGTAQLTGNTTIGSAANPVLIIVNGNLSITGNTNINGFLFIVGATSSTVISGTFNLTGGMAAGDSLTITGNSSITYNSAMLVGVQTSAQTNYYAKVPGSWKDY